MLCVSRAVLSVVLAAWSVRFVGWADWVDCRCFLSFVFLGVARRLELSPCNTPLGSTPLPVQGKGVVKTCVGNYMDHNGLNHPVDLEIENVYWVPYSSMKVLATPEINTQNIFLFTGPRGNELIMPGFANQKLGKFFDCEQEVDDAGSPVLVFNLGKGRPIMRSHHVDDGLVWTDVTDVLKNDTAIREIAAVQQPEGMDYMPTPFLAYLAYGHCGDAAMRLIAKASELYVVHCPLTRQWVCVLIVKGVS